MIQANEPTNPELYDFVLNHYLELKFSRPQKNINLIIKRKNPKRVSREIRKEMAKAQKSGVGVPPVTRAQEALRVELEENKKQRKSISKIQKETEKQEKFALKQIKKKKKQRGH